MQCGDGEGHKGERRCRRSGADSVQPSERHRAGDGGRGRGSGDGEAVGADEGKREGGGCEGGGAARDNGARQSVCKT